MKHLFQRLADWRHERLIRRLCEETKAHVRRGDRDAAQAALVSLTAAVTTRSPQQVARMERAMGLPHA